jgi:two-component system cell cycle sensor histidine kinase/response regulator CckA
MTERAHKCDTAKASESTRLQALEREVAQLRHELVDARVGPAAPIDSLLNELLRDRTVLEKLPDSIAVLDRNHQILYINRALPGLTVAQMHGTALVDYLPWTERQAYCQMYESLWRTGQESHFELATALGIWWESRFVPIKARGAVRCILACGRDITPHKRAQEALRQSESQLRLALDATGMGTWTWLASSDQVTWDAALARIYGLTPEQAPRNYAQYVRLIHPDDRERVEQALRHAVELGTYADLEHRILRPDGETRYILAKGDLIRDERGSPCGFRGGAIDVTGKKRLEEQLNQVQKMEAIGQLTAGIAHNFNNLLSVILPNVGLARQAQGDEQAAHLADIEYAANRAADMVNQLLLFARQGKDADRRALDLGALAQRTAQFCRCTFERAVRIDVHVPLGLPLAHANAGQIEQVLLNICLNARDALLDAHVDQPRIDITLMPAPSAGGSVCMRISDNGPGMDEATRRRVFEPFFSTKEVGRGTGLGLASAYAIMTEHHGRIRCESLPGRGACFEIELPLSAAAPERARIVLAQEPARGSETVLVVDDEPLVRRACAAMLAHGGYRVLQAEDGQKALELVQSRSEPIAMVLLDRSMPGLSGDQIVARLHELDAELPVALLTGQPGQGDCEPTTLTLSKPIDAMQLLRAVRSAIDERRSA